MNTSKIVAQKKNGKAVKQLNSRGMKGNNSIKKPAKTLQMKLIKLHSKQGLIEIDVNLEGSLNLTDSCNRNYF